MKLLMITRKVDRADGLAGFTYNWIKKLSQHLDQLYVICLEKGDADNLPPNVEIFSLGKEKGKNKIREFINFHKFAAKLVPKVDGIFAHQNPEYGILISPWAKIHRKKLIAWYVHKQVGFKLKLLNILVDKIISINKQSLRLASKKVVWLHHGIDTDIFSFQNRTHHEETRLLTVGRISPTKRIDLMIDLLSILKKKLTGRIIFKIAGEPTLLIDHDYLSSLKNKVKELNLEENVIFLGSVANDQVPVVYQWADIFFNFSKTGSVDKNVLEAASCGNLILTNNPAFDFLPGICRAENDNIEQLLAKLEKLINLPDSEREALSRQLRLIVVREHNLDNLVEKIIDQFYG